MLQGVRGSRQEKPQQKNLKAICFLRNTCIDPLKNYKATQRAIIGPPAKRLFNSISVSGRRWPALFTLKNDKKKTQTLSNLRTWTPPPSPLTKVSRSAYARVNKPRRYSSAYVRLDNCTCICSFWHCRLEMFHVLMNARLFCGKMFIVAV